MKKIKDIYKYAASLKAYYVYMAWADEGGCYEGIVTSESLGNDDECIDRFRHESLYDDNETTFEEAVILAGKVRRQFPKRTVKIGDNSDIVLDSIIDCNNPAITEEQETVVRAYLLGMYKAYEILEYLRVEKS